MPATRKNIFGNLFVGFKWVILFSPYYFRTCWYSHQSWFTRFTYQFVKASALNHMNNDHVTNSTGKQFVGIPSPRCRLPLVDFRMRTKKVVALSRKRLLSRWECHWWSSLSLSLYLLSSGMWIQNCLKNGTTENRIQMPEINIKLLAFNTLHFNYLCCISSIIRCQFISTS